MAKIDVTKIEGYSEMTAEQKLQALESYEMDMSGFIRKEQFDKVASEVADWKKKYNAKLTEEEKIQAQQREEQDKLMNELETLRREKQMSEAKSNFLSLGYDDELATTTAKAFVEGDMATVFANQKKHQESIEKKVKTDILKGTPKPGSAGGDVKLTKADLHKMSVAERMTFAQEHPEEYKEIYK